MKYIFSLLALAGLLFVGCGGGGDNSTGGSSSIVSASASKGANGANYLFSGTLDVSWQGKVVANSVTLSNISVHIDNIAYSAGFVTAISAAIEKDKDGFSSVNQVRVPFTFVKTLPYSNTERWCTIHMDYTIGKNTKAALPIPCKLEKFTDSGSSVAIETLSAPAAANHSAQAIQYAGKLQEDNSILANKTISYSILSPAGLVASPTKGSLTTNANGIFNFELKTTSNPSEEAREIVVLFAYSGSTATWKITQAGKPATVPPTIKAIYKDQNLSQAGGSVKYIGTLMRGATGTSGAIQYEVIPSNVVTTATGTTPADSSGSFSLDLDINANNTGSARTISVVLRHSSANETWKITQSN